MPKPNFICIGAPKAGTTTLYYLVQPHPEVFVTTPKELHFFNRNELYQKGMDWYLKHFEGAERHKAIGEFSVTYSAINARPDVPRRMAEHLPNLKIILMTRDPIKRIESHWLELRLGAVRTKLPFNEALTEIPSLVDFSNYHDTYTRYAEIYGRDNVMAIVLEQFQKDPAENLRRVFEFLGVDPDWRDEHAVTHRNIWNQKMEDGAVLSMVREAPVFTHVRNAMPKGLRQGLRKLFKKPIPGRPIWDPQMYEQIAAPMRVQADRMLDELGLPRDTWTLQPTEPLPDHAGGGA